MMSLSSSALEGSLSFVDRTLGQYCYQNLWAGQTSWSKHMADSLRASNLVLDMVFSSTGYLPSDCSLWVFRPPFGRVGSMVPSVLQIEKLLDLPLLEGWRDRGGSSRRKSFGHSLFPFSRWSNLEGQRLTPGPTVSKGGSGSQHSRSNRTQAGP